MKTNCNNYYIVANKAVYYRYDQSSHVSVLPSTISSSDNTDT